MSIHDGHRNRLKERFAKEGIDGFTDVQVLELLLFYCIPRQDTNPIAHELLRRFGSLWRVMETPLSELEQVPGIGHNAAVFLHLIREAGRYYQVDRVKTGNQPTTLEECADYLLPHFIGRINETVFLLCLDSKCKIICCREITEGTANAAALSVRKVVDIAVKANASSVVLAHNHPSGIAVPSGEDIATTRRIAAALYAVEIELVDHIVVADDDYVSMVQSGYYRPGEFSVIA